MIDYKPRGKKFRKEQNLLFLLKVITPLPCILLIVPQSSLPFSSKKRRGQWLMTFWSHPRSSQWYTSVPHLHSPYVQRQPTISSAWSSSGQCPEWILAATVQSYTSNLNQVKWICVIFHKPVRYIFTFCNTKTFNSNPFISVLSTRQRCNVHTKPIHVRDLRFSCQRCWMLKHSGELCLADW
jgi:hypothetical protein